MSIASEFAGIAATLNQEPDVGETLDGIVHYACASFDSDHVGIHIVRAGDITTAASTDAVIEQADKMQVALGEGPCLQTVWSHGSLVVEDTATDPRWPKFGPAAADLGLRSILSVRLFVGNQTLGALNFYSTRVREYSDDDIDLAKVFGQHAAVALASAEREENLKLAIDARNLIGQAQGILMERFGISADRAFSVLRRYSQANNVKLHEVALRIVETRGLPGEPPSDQPAKRPSELESAG